MELHGKNFVGEQLTTGTGKTFSAFSPFDNAMLPGSFYEASETDGEAALQLAHEAFQSFRRSSGKQRAALLERMAEEILALGDALITRARLETGLPEARLTGERMRTVNQLRLFAQVAREGVWVDARIDHALPDRQPAPRPDLRRMLAPIGPVVIFGASNFPLAFSVAGGDSASALATGNPIIVKAHEAHPGTSELVATALRRAIAATQASPGIFSMLHGPGKTIGMQLVRHPKTRAVGFTGSRKAGRALFDAAATRAEPIPVFAEMSSLNPVFILPRCLRERGPAIAEGLKTSMTLGVGQFCTKPGLVFTLANSDLEPFANALARGVEKVAPGTMLHSGISHSYRAGLQEVSRIDGARLLARSETAADAGRPQAEAAVLHTDYANYRKHTALSEELFGPFAVVITASSLKELEQAARELDGQLTATVHGTPEDLAEAGPLLSLLEEKAGRLIINGYPTGVEVCPAMNHGGPYPATTDVRFTSVGTAALYRFVRPVCYQDFPDTLLPDELKETNPLGLKRLVDGKQV